ncbi:MAG: cadmium-translocating P-type ATPase [Clostridia bacterium]|nr:cadmium-translocating P-type ATPase [Clostridia bacterium]
MNKKQKNVLVRILVSAVLLLGLHFFLPETLPRWVALLCYLVPYLIIGHDILRKAWKGILHRQPFDECFLMAVATVGALLLGLLRTGDFDEAVAVMLFYQTGELFQSYAVGKSRRSITELMDIRPDTAHLEAEDGSVETVDPDEVEVGSVIVVKPGERVPIDGIVLSGVSALDTAALTGESLPRDVKPGDEALSGCVNQGSVLRLRTTRDFGESTASKIMDMVENASSLKSRSEAFITRFARVYTPAVCFAALALALLGPLVRLLMGLTPDWGDWLMRALTFLVISCPCALVISIPLTFFAGLGGASREGVLIKGSNYLEALADTGIAVFDKTGTMTQGVFEVSAVHHAAIPEEELITLAAHAECFSTHPISLSLRRACAEPIDETRVTDVREEAGGGVIAKVDGREVACGNTRLMERLGIPCDECHSLGTVVHVAVDGSYCGHILIADHLKPHAAEAIRALREAGVRRTVMLTGDREAAAKQMAADLGVNSYQAGLLPQDKVTWVEKLLAEKTGSEKLAFVGDGLNDAPVLSRADLGIAMGALGSDAAIEAADVVLMDDDPLKIARAIAIARKCMRIVRENIVFAIGVKLICLLVSALGLGSMWLAIFADVGVMVLAVLNAIRALR